MIGLLRHCIAASLAATAVAALAVPAFAAIAPAAAPNPIPVPVAAAVADWGRPPADMLRDATMKPAEVMSFATVQRRDNVVDFVPGDGYYTRILAKLVGDNGAVYPLVPDMAKDRPTLHKLFEPMLALSNVTDYANVVPFWEPLTQYGGQFSLPVQLNVVFTDGGYHQLHNAAFGAQGIIVPVLKQVLASLDLGGALVIADYAAAKGAGFSQTETLGRAEEDAVKAEVLSAGFVLDGESNVLTNPKDDHTKPWDDASLMGAPDRFLLRFRKPTDAPKNARPQDVSGFDDYYGNTEHTDMYTNDPKIERWVLYHPDGTYQEYGNTGTRVQAGTFYWDAAGHNCQLHQFPADQRGYIVCHSDPLGKHVGDVWMQNNGGEATMGDIRYRLEKGFTVPLERIVAP